MWCEAVMLMTVVVNDRAMEIAVDSTAADLLAHLGIDPARVAVVVGADIIGRSDLGGRVLRPGDIIELLSFVGGGS